ncbi:MAG: cytochrome c [Candidatus Competibacteraceae bacterium]|uniref:Cytochrome c class II n=2 Tax=Candidatus Contendibacter odensensis TaxID=1400860 RepID=A0A7U7G8X0_9GAMM|nr:cytochrome c [Candidatus Competibacteraceae bacterium]CDH43892.1 putative Cytochrome c class II [Candidatus Contendobacter odensis Run_B_J11]
MNKVSQILVGGALGLSILTAASAADPKPQDTVDYRKSVYTIIGWNFAPIGAMMKGEVPFDAAAVVRHAQYVEMMSKAAPEGFTKGSGPDAVKDTEAKPEIWTNWDKFEAKMNDFQQEAAKLTEVAKGGNEGAIKAQFGKTAETCKACHKAFRKD